MNKEQQQTMESFATNKEMVSIFSDQIVGQMRLSLLHWIKDLLEKPHKSTIKQQEDKLKELPHVDISLLNQIQQGNAEYRMNQFNTISETILNEFTQLKMKEGNLYMRSFTLKRWKQQKVRLDEIQKQLIIFSSSTKIKNLDLSTYVIKWVGQKKEYQAFSLDSISASNKYKSIILGWINFDGSRIWYDSIAHIISSPSPLHKNPLLPSQLNLFQSNQIIDDSFITSNSSINLTNFNRKNSLESQQLEKAEKPNQSLFLSVQSNIIQNQNNLQTINHFNNTNTNSNSNTSTSPNLTNTKSNPILNPQTNANITTNPNTNTDSNPNPNIYSINNPNSMTNPNPSLNSMTNPNSNLNPSFNPSLNLNPNSNLNLNPNSNLNSNSNSNPNPNVLVNNINSHETSNFTKSIEEHIQSQKRQNSYDFEPTIQYQQTSFDNSSTKITLKTTVADIQSDTENSIIMAHNKNDVFNQTEEKSVVSKIVASRNQQITSNNLTVQQNNQTTNNQATLDEIKKPIVILELLQTYKIQTIEDEREYKTIQFKNGMRLLQNKDDPKKYKIFQAFQGVSAFEVFNCICNIDDYPKWNNNISETTMLNLMSNEQTAIIYAKHKGISITYRPRDYVYLRHAFIENDKYIIIDKSIEYDSHPSFISTIRGEIEHVVWCVKTHPSDDNRSLMIADFNYNNSGYSNNDQNASITFSYLTHFSNLSEFIAQKSFSQSFSLNMFDILDISTEKTRVNVHQSCQSNRKPTTSQQGDCHDNQLFTKDIRLVESCVNHEDNNTSYKSSLNDDDNDDYVNDNDIFQHIDVNEQPKEIQSNQDFEQHIPLSNNQNQCDNDFKTPLINLFQVQIPRDKLKGRRMSEIFSMINNNEHWRFCLDEDFKMGRILCEEQLMKSDQKSGHYQFKNDWERDLKTGKFVFLNKEKIATQKKVISFLLQKIGSNIMSGKSIMSISLPVDIFESRSNTERFAQSCGFAPVFLKRAGQSIDPLEQMKNTAIYLITTTILYLDLEKPFNPILGETYQGRLDGYPFYCEQISHHPPICAYSYYTDTYTLNGQVESIAQMHANSVTGLNQGNVVVKFINTNNQIGLIQAPGSLNGTAIGTRYMSVDGKYIAYDLKNKLILEIKVNPDKKSFFKAQTTTIDYLAGGIYSVTDKFITKFMTLQPHFYKFTGLNFKEDVISQLAVITGHWNHEIFIDDIKWFDIQHPFPHLLQREINPLPSDCNFRQDILALRNNDKILAQTYKDQLEDFQRTDRKNREKISALNKKNKKSHK